MSDSSASPEASVGPPCSLLEPGISVDTFLENLTKLSPARLTNAHVLDLHKYIVGTKTKWEAVKEALSKAYKQDWSSMPVCSLNSAFIGLYE